MLFGLSFGIRESASGGVPHTSLESHGDRSGCSCAAPLKEHSGLMTGEVGLMQNAVKVFLMITMAIDFAAVAYYTYSSVVLGAYLAGCTFVCMGRPSNNEEPVMQNLSARNVARKIAQDRVMLCPSN